MRRRRLAMVSAGLVLAVPGIARGDGLPVPVDDAGGSGVVREARAPDRIVALRAGRNTLVARVRREGGRVVHSRLLRGRFTIPAVALDGSASGLSGDGSTLVLINPRKRFPRAQTTLTVLDGQRLRVQRVLTLRGDFSFDALSPDGASLYLIHYVSPRDPTRYAVRLYDLVAGRLRPGRIVDPREPDERMRGLPITRVASGDGRWHYTLYDGAGSYPFIHALDTVRRTAFCIDLDALARPAIDRYALRMTLAGDGSRLAVRDGAAPLAVVDTTTFRVRTPDAGAPVAPAVDGGPGSVPPIVAAVLVLLVAGGAVALRRRRAARVAPPAGPPPEPDPAVADAKEDGTSERVALV
jgi:MYXO-CTERM domain-containing protein